MNLNNFTDIKLRIEEIYKNRVENFLDLVVESKVSGISLLKLVKETQIKFFGNQIKDSIIYVTYSEMFYNYVKLRPEDFVMIKEIKYIKEEENLSFYTNNSMKFDHIIMNPPYGKVGTLATTIIRMCLNFSEEIHCLCQPRSIEKNGVYEHVVEADIVPNFFDAGLDELAISTIKKDYTEGKQILYGKRDICENDLEYWIVEFNKGKKIWPTIPHLSCKPNVYKKIVEEKKSFFIFGCMEMGNTITANGNSTGYRYNVKKEAIIWAGDIDPQHPEKGPLKNGKDCYAYDCGTEKAKENLISVYYEIPKTGFFSIRNSQKNEYAKGVSYAEQTIPFIDWEHLDSHPLWKKSKEKAFLSELIKEGGQKIVIAYLKAKGSKINWNATDEEIEELLK